MRLVSAEPSYEPAPRIRRVPAGANTAESECAIELANAYVLDGKPLFDWQEDVISSWLAVDENGKYSCPTCGLLLPRQNGKTKGCLVSRMVEGAVGRGEVIRYSAHRVDTMQEIFDIVVDIFGDSRVPSSLWRYPELHELVKKEIFTNGHLEIKFKNGAALKFVARSTGSGRGSSVDVNIYDEAQFLTIAQLADALPAQSAAPSGNPQTIYVGTPPEGNGDTGEAFGQVRQAAIDGKPGICWHEWSVDEVGDVGDRGRWYACNPALGHQLLLSQVEQEFAQMPALQFAIERLDYWPTASMDLVINMDAWNHLESDGPANADIVKRAIGVKFAPDGSRVSVAGAVVDRDGNVHAELIYDEPNDGGLAWLIEWLLKGKGQIAMVSIDGKAGAQELSDRLIQAHFPKAGVQILSAKEMCAVTTTAANGAMEHSITHKPDVRLNLSASSSVRRPIGRDGFGFGGDDATAIEAWAIAAWTVKTTKRDPSRKTRLIK